MSIPYSTISTSILLLVSVFKKRLFYEVTKPFVGSTVSECFFLLISTFRNQIL